MKRLPQDFYLVLDDVKLVEKMKECLVDPRFSGYEFAGIRSMWEIQVEIVTQQAVERGGATYPELLGFFEDLGMM